MSVVTHHDRFIEIDERIRVEAGKKLIKANATRTYLANEAMFKDKAGNPHYELGGFDAGGHMDENGQHLGSKVIKEGEVFHHIDWNGPDVFFVYVLDDDDTVHSSHPLHPGKRWFEKAEFATWNEAVAFAKTL